MVFMLSRPPICGGPCGTLPWSWGVSQFIPKNLALPTLFKGGSVNGTGGGVPLASSKREKGVRVKKEGGREAGREGGPKSSDSALIRCKI